MIQGILWDKDGILFDMEPIYCEANRTVLAEFGVNISEQEYYEHWTRRGKTLKDLVKSKGLRIDVDKVLIKRALWLKNKLSHGVPIIPGANEALQRMKLYPYALVTSSYKPETDIALEFSGFGAYFKYVITIEDVIYNKPNPAGFLFASEKLGISPSDLLVIEDAEKGVIAAKKAGMKCIAIPNQYTRNNDFSSADIILDSLDKLTLDLIKKLEE